MDKLDYLYRGFKHYRNQTEDNSCKRERRTIKKTNVEFDKFTVKKYRCTINDDWIIEIEKGLVFIEKAVAEERQFIRTDGETVPIEKAKKASRDSVVHLARHANMITHVPEKEGDPIVPDALYIVEKLADYAVYENRFLYMLLIQLKEFVSMRMAKITKLRMTYICDFEYKKNLESKVRNLSASNTFHEERYDNPFPIDTKESKDLLQRIEDIEQIILMLLNTNLMIDVSKAPMIKPPITKTNVLKMNNNFKNALALYDFICSYKKDGYEAEEVIVDFVPFRDEIADEISELPMLTSFLTYKYGNDLSEMLENNYQKEEERLKAIEDEKFLERIKRVKKKILESGMGYEEYIVLLEKRNKQLEKSAEDLLIAKNEIFKLNSKIEELNQNIENLNRQIDKLDSIIQEKDEEINRLNQKYIDDMNELMRKYDEEIKKLKISFENERNDLIVKQEIEIERLNEEFELEKERVREEAQEEMKFQMEDYELEINSLRDNIADLNTSKENLILEKDSLINKLIEENNKSIDEYEEKLTNVIDDYKNQINNLNDVSEENNNRFKGEIERLDKALVGAYAELDALRHETGATLSRDYTTKDGFIQLEKEFDYFNDFFKSEWKKTKKAIRKRLLWTKEEKKKAKLEGGFNKERNLDDFDNKEE